jgi:hypothetical protein
LINVLTADDLDVMHAAPESGARLEEWACQDVSSRRIFLLLGQQSRIMRGIDSLPRWGGIARRATRHVAALRNAKQRCNCSALALWEDWLR